MNAPSPLPIQHVPAAHRFELHTGGHTNVAEYSVDGRKLIVTHTFVHPSLEGRGIGAALVEAAITEAHAQGLIIDATCSFARAHLQRRNDLRGLQR